MATKLFIYLDRRSQRQCSQRISAAAGEAPDPRQTKAMHIGEPRFGAFRVVVVDQATESSSAATGQRCVETTLPLRSNRSIACST